ncbi:MAG: hypothetical protein HQL76_08780 [Magnetococcales bacterium]|nr:hypothetical protein [Magnetococcales bacterium]
MIFLLFRAIVMAWTAFLALEAHAEWENKVQNAWDATRKAGQEVLNDTTDVGKKALDATGELKDKAVTRAREWMGHQPRDPDQERFDRVWEEALGKLDRALATHETWEQAPESSLLGADKNSVRQEFDELLDELLAILADPGIDASITEINHHRQRITDLEESILRDKEARITAPVKHLVKTTQEDLDRNIKNTQTEILHLKRDINRKKEALQTRLQHIGITLSPEQLDVLLARIDSEDILQMAAVFDILKQITQQLMTLTRESGENLQAARRYYGMHMVLLECVVHMQRRYIDHVERRYIAGIMNITDETTQLTAETRQEMQHSQQPHHRTLYEKNLAAQLLTLKTARLYLQHLHEQRIKVEQARSRSIKDLEVAKNTYRTVRIGSQLMDLLQASQQGFDTLMGLQVPEVVPFENLEMHKKYEELSSRLAAQTP